MNKFNVGQTAYLIYEINSEHEANDDMLVIRTISKDDLGYHYSVEDSNEDIIDWCREDDLFGSINDAIEECVMRNLLGGNKNGME